MCVCSWVTKIGISNEIQRCSNSTKCLLEVERKDYFDLKHYKILHFLTVANIHTHTFWAHKKEIYVYWEWNPKPKPSETNILPLSQWQEAQKLNTDKIFKSCTWYRIAGNFCWGNIFNYFTTNLQWQKFNRCSFVTWGFDGQNTHLLCCVKLYLAKSFIYTLKEALQLPFLDDNFPLCGRLSVTNSHTGKVNIYCLFRSNYFISFVWQMMAISTS